MKGLLIGVLALVVVAASGCGDDKELPTTPSGPAGPAVITQFSALPASAKVPATVEFNIKTTDALTCEIPGIGDVTCNGVKGWTINVTGTHTFTLFAYGAGGQIARQSAIVVVTP